VQVVEVSAVSKKKSKWEVSSWSGRCAKRRQTDFSTPTRRG